MTGRQFNHIENKIKQAAENFQPVYHELAWDRMEALLDKKKKKKSPVYWWWVIPVFFLISVIIFYQIMPASSVNKEVVKNDTPIHTATEGKTIAKNSIIQKATTISLSPINKIIDNAAVKNIRTGIKKVENKSTPARFDKKNPIEIELEKKASLLRESAIKINGMVTTEIDLTRSGDNNKNQLIEIEAWLPEIKKNDTLIEKKVIPMKKETKTENKNSFLSKVYITATGGLEAPGLKTFSNSGSKISVKSGLGLGYQINKKFTLETGFFLGSKKYITGPENYKYPDDSYWNTVELTKVVANCLIYEIPLLLRYNFFQEKSVLLNVGGGLESFIMQKEHYIYDYLKNGTEHTSARSYDGNSHFLSSIQFSIGLEKQFNQKISFHVIPSVSIPLNGVGNGKVKLHSTSIQAGIKYFPFQKK